MNHAVDTNHGPLDQFRSYLYLLARAHLGPRGGNRIDASDLVQQTMMDAHAKRDQFRGATDAEWAAWLRKILSCNLADALRHQHRAISADSVQTHKLFKQVWNLNFTLLSDEEAEVPKKYGVPVRRGGRVQPRGPNRNHLLGDDGERIVVERPATFVRWTFVIGKDGEIAYKNTKVRAAKDSKQVLDFLQIKIPELPKNLAGK